MEQGRPSAPASPICGLQAADHRRTWLCAAIADRCRAVVRGVQPAIWARFNRRHLERAVRRMPSVSSSERLTAALLDRLTHHVHILEMNGDSYRLYQSKRQSWRASSDTPEDN